ncbi:hypothetical protein RE6C_01831 [Rhodopirellula europaea 6C]|uniref:Uncharacterized protein n=1 Tax=Rhodopirellula europaea 6C TaxID=1263867 RepID=M2B6B2_9BACT|nr:hypothetical protein RE6C_01831 [Rhodopirellula europaea 6C]
MLGDFEDLTPRFQRSPPDIRRWRNSFAKRSELRRGEVVNDAVASSRSI